MWNGLLYGFLKLLHRTFDLPEFVVAQINRQTSKVEYLFDAQNSIWCSKVDDAALFDGILDVLLRFRDFDMDKHVVISYLDRWSDNDILQEIKNGSENMPRV